VSNAAAPPFAAAARAGRPVAWLMIGLLLLQWAAQVCAVHCGMAAPADARPTIGAASVVPPAAGGSDAVPPIHPTSPAAQGAASPVGVPSAAAAPAATGLDSPCLLIAWCDLGQVAMVAIPPGPDAEPPARSGIAAPPGRAPSFLRAPEERPPTA
jgi:hypothetical protein